jgi:hypothetical protein
MTYLVQQGVIYLLASCIMHIHTHMHTYKTHKYIYTHHIPCPANYNLPFISLHHASCTYTHTKTTLTYTHITYLAPLNYKVPFVSLHHASCFDQLQGIELIRLDFVTDT